MLMARLSLGKLLYSKWTAVQPTGSEKHFVVISQGGKKSQQPGQVTLQAVLTRRAYTLDWRDLTDEQHWRQGWHEVAAPDHVRAPRAPFSTCEAFTI
jgi:tryptophan-rich hypothetical protein